MFLGGKFHVLIQIKSVLLFYESFVSFCSKKHENICLKKSVFELFINKTLV